MSNFIIVGIYADNKQRFADTYEADTAQEAEAIALAEVESPLIIAGTFLIHRDDEKTDSPRMTIVA